MTRRMPDRRQFALAATALLLACAFTLAPVHAQAPKKVAADKSFIRFVTKQMGVPVEGKFRTFDAAVEFDPKKPEATKAVFEVELASIDMGSAEGETESKRPLWFNVDAFPRARFTAQVVRPMGSGRYEASGALTIKGVTQNITTSFSLVEGSGMRTVEGQFVLKRLAYRIGEKQWADTETVADEVSVRYRFVIPA